MSQSVLVPPVGLTWGVTRAPVWSTTKIEATSGREFRSQNFTYPRYLVKQRYDVLRQTPTYTEMATLVGFFNARGGDFDTFLWTDPDDNSVTDQLIGVANGVANSFQLQRTFGGFNEPVFDVNSAPVIKDNGVVSSYSISSTGLITFIVPPTAGHTITWTGTFYRRMRFNQSSAEFSQFMRLLWELGELQMMSSKP